MISASDIIKLPFTSDLTEGGIAYAARALAQNYGSPDASVYTRLRRIVGSVATELAFRRYLGEKGVPFRIKSALPFSAPDRYDVLLGGRRCNINTYLAAKRSQITAMRRSPEMILSGPALIPEDQLSPPDQTGKELLLFAFLLGLTTNSPEEIHKAVESKQPIYLIHPLQAGWSNPPAWATLGRLALKSESAAPLTVEIGGQDASRNFITEKLTLAPLTRTFAQNNYYSLAYLHVDGLPTARVGIHSAGRNEIYLIHSHEWGNIWIYGLEIWLAGYISENEFRRKASTTFAGSRVFQYSKTQTKSLSVPVSDLRSLEDLFAQVTRWDAEKKSR